MVIPTASHNPPDNFTLHILSHPFHTAIFNITHITLIVALTLSLITCSRRISVVNSQCLLNTVPPMLSAFNRPTNSFGGSGFWKLSSAVSSTLFGLEVKSWLVGVSSLSHRGVWLFAGISKLVDGDGVCTWHWASVDQFGVPSASLILSPTVKQQLNN